MLWCAGTGAAARRHGAARRRGAAALARARPARLRAAAAPGPPPPPPDNSSTRTHTTHPRLYACNTHTTDFWTKLILRGSELPINCTCSRNDFRGKYESTSHLYGRFQYNNVL